MKDKYESFSEMVSQQVKNILLSYEPMKPTLQKIGIEVFWVKEDGNVTVENFSQVF